MLKGFKVSGILYEICTVATARLALADPLGGRAPSHSADHHPLGASTNTPDLSK